jgi:amyotrophic lateral sclerosis 2 protein
MSEWISLMKRIYTIFRFLFPYLPSCDQEQDTSGSEDECESHYECKLLSPLNFMHQLLLNDEIYSCFFLLYASKNSKQDELYAQRLATCEKKTNEELRQLIKIEPNLIPLLENVQFDAAIKRFHQLSQQYSPSEMLQIINDTFVIINDCSKTLSDGSELLSADNLLSITIYLIIKAGINHFGAELSLLTDLMENDVEKLINMEQYIYTTVKIAYLHTISSRFFHN